MVHVLYTHIIQLYIYTYICWIHTDAIIIKTSEDFFRRICTSHFIARFACERELETEQNYNILTPTHMAISVVSFLFSRAAQPEAQLSAECWLSLPHLVTNGSPNSLGVPRAPSARWWLSLPHLVSELSDLQLADLDNSSVTHSIFGMACLIVITQK